MRGWRKTKDLFSPLPAEQAAPDNQLLRDVIRERIAALPKPKQAELKSLWPAGAPKLANCTVPQLNQIGDLIDTISPQEEW